MSRRKQLNPKPLKTDILAELKNQSQKNLDAPTNCGKADLSPSIYKTRTLDTNTSEQDKQDVLENNTVRFLSDLQLKTIENLKEEVQALLSNSSALSKYSGHELEKIGALTLQINSDNEFDKKSHHLKNNNNQKNNCRNEQVDSVSQENIKEINPAPLEDDLPLSNNKLKNAPVSNSILVNGKRYYPLRFSCENCGLRYSDQSTLMIHKKNYCSKRHCSKSPRSSSNTSKSSSSRSPSNSSHSSSPSPNRSPSTSEGTSNNDSTHSKETKSTISNKKSKINESGCESSNFSDTESREENTGVRLVKSVIYQCNSCMFQTDKKSIMNRHSRVHLAQKRKSMEDLLENNNCDLTGSESGSNKIQKFDINNNSKLRDVERPIEKSGIASADEQSKLKSYCTDCDIQFSSVTTYQHHRNNYCQKYKTIEAIVPMDKASGSSQEKKAVIQNDPEKLIKMSGIKSEQTRLNKSLIFDNSQEAMYLALDQSNEYQLALAKVLNEKKASLGPVQMGDMVYLPAYKVSDHHQQQQALDKSKLIEHENMVLKQFLQSNTKLMHQMSLLQAQQQQQQSQTDTSLDEMDELIVSDRSENIAYLKHYQNLVKPLTLREVPSAISLPNKTTNDPLKLSVKQIITPSTLNQHDSSKAVKNFLKQRQQLGSSQIQNLTNYGPQIAFGRASQMSPYFPAFNSNLMLNQSHNQHLTNMLSNSNSLVNPLFLNPQRFSLLDQIATIQTQKQELPAQNKMYHCHRCQQLFFEPKTFETHTCSYKEDKNHQQSINRKIISPIKSSPDPQINRNNHMTLRTSQIDDDLLKHPLVIKTIRETYGTKLKSPEAQGGAISSSFDNQPKNFFVCTTCGYRGNTIRGVKQHGKLHLTQCEQFAVLNISSEFNEPILAYNSNSDIELQQNSTQSKPIDFGELDEESANNTITIDVSNNRKTEFEESRTNTNKNEISSPSGVPFSKKARILDKHFSQQKTLMPTKSEPANGVRVIGPAAIEKSHTFCFKCNIQFQQISNFLAHKKLYCK